MKKTLVMAAVLIGLSVCMVASAADVAVVDMEELVKAHPKSDVNRDILRDQLVELEREKDAMLETFEAKKSAFLDARKAAGDPAVSEAVRAERDAEASRQLKELQEMEQDLNQRLMERQREMNEQKLRMHQTVEEAVQKLVARVATKKNIALVIDKSAVGIGGSSVVVFHEAKLDVTDLVMQEIQALRNEE